MKNLHNLKVIAIVAIIGLGLTLVSFKPSHPTSAVTKQIQRQTVDDGYFLLGGQEYHVYTDVAYGTVIALYRSVAGVDQSAIITFSEYEYDGSTGILSVHISFTDGGSKFYNGAVYY